MIKIYCDICGKEPTDRDFACDLKVIEILTSLKGESMIPQQEKQQSILQICKGCYYTHISKLFKNEKKRD